MTDESTAMDDGAEIAGARAVHKERVVSRLQQHIEPMGAGSLRLPAAIHANLPLACHLGLGLLALRPQVQDGIELGVPQSRP